MSLDSRVRIFLGASTGLFLGLSASQPVTKTGPCPALTRYNAPAGETWTQFNAEANPASTYPPNTVQNPLEPEESINCIEVPAGMKAELWASEKSAGNPTPAMAYLQHITFDEKGRVWAVEPRSYPNIIRPATNSVTDQKFQGGTDRILILEDTDGDKVMDKVKVFKDGLNLPQGIEVVNGGVVVAMTPYLVFFPSVNDVAGTPQILFSGMGSSGTSWDTHGGINSLMYGLDNWIYGHTGFNACNVDGVDCSQGRVWRFRHPALGHAEKKFEVWTDGPQNAWGIGQSEDGQIFQSGATGTPHINHGLRPGVAAIDIRNGTGRELYYPITGDRWLWEGSTAKDGNGWFTSSTTAVSGLQFYTSRLLPEKYWGRFAFTCEGSSKLCNQDSLVVSGTGNVTGSTWRAVRMPGPQRSNLLASTDAWVAPLLAKTGPDGAVWVLDWYNYLFLHNPATPSGPGFAWNNHLRTKTRSRIYRITPADKAPEPVLNLANANLEQLVSTLWNPNMLWRLHAQRILLSKGWSAELGDMLEKVLKTDRWVDPVGSNPQVLHALWILHGLDRFTADAARWNPILADLLTHPAWGVRRNVLRAMPRTTASAEAIGAKCAVNDGHGHVRLQALLALADITAKPAGLPALWDTYRTVDTYAGTAFTASGITSAATQPCSPTLAAPGPKTEPPLTTAISPLAQPRSDLRFAAGPDGFRLLPHGQLPDGELTVWDAQGRPVFQSAYQAAERRWSRAEAKGLPTGVHLYAFRGVDGTLIQGRLSLAGRP